MSAELLAMALAMGMAPEPVKQETGDGPRYKSRYGAKQGSAVPKLTKGRAKAKAARAARKAQRRAKG